MKYRFTYEITSNCNYKCDYCVVFKDEKYSDLKTIDCIIDFFRQLNNQEDTDIIEIQLFGGEPTLHPEFLYIIEELSKLDKVKFILFTNLSANLDLYKQFCEIAGKKIEVIAASYHYNHCDSIKFINKIDYLINNYDNNIEISCMLANNRYSENEYYNIFNQFKDCSNFKLCLFPIIEYNTSKIIEPTINKIENNNNMKISIDKNTDNTRYEQKCDSFITNAFISSYGILYRCFQYKDLFRLNLCNNKNVMIGYRNFCKIQPICYKPKCYRYAKWDNYG